MQHLLVKSIALGALALTAACNGDTVAQKEVEQKADAIEASYDAEADLVEAQAENAPDEKVAEAKAEVLRAKGDREADRLKDMADELDDVPAK
jgi:hypothetical protein